MTKAQLITISSNQMMEKERVSKIATKQKQKNIFYITPTTYWVTQVQLIEPSIKGTTFDSFIRLYMASTKREIQEWSTDQWKLLMSQKLAGNHRVKQQTLDTYVQLKRFGRLQPSPSLAFLEQDFRNIEEAEQLEFNCTIDDLYWLASKSKSTLSIDEIVFEGFVDFTVLQFDMISFLLDQGVACTVYLDREATYAIADLSEIGFKRMEEGGGNRAHRDAMLYSATTKEEEQLGIIEHLLASETPYTDIAVLFTKSDQRRSFSEKARRANVPLVSRRQTFFYETNFYLWLKEGVLLPSRTREEQVSAADLLFPLLNLKGRSYLAAKQAFIRTGKTGITEVDDLLTECWSFKVEKGMSLQEQVEKLLKMITKLHEVSPIDFLQELVGEMRSKIKSIHKVVVDTEMLHQWLESFATNFVVEERENQKGVSVLSWADLGAFHGKTLYIGGMEAGVFPVPYGFLGYVQEEDLQGKTKYGLPYRERTRAGQFAQFQQIFKREWTVYASYVVGLNPENPSLPSSFVKSLHLAGHWSFHNRLKVGKSFFSAADKKAFDGADNEVTKRLLRLETGKEWLNDAQAKKQRSRKTVTVTELEAFARCPFRYGLERLLHIQAPIEYDDGFPRHLIGSVIHSIIEKLYRQHLNIIGKCFGGLSEKSKDAVPEWLRNEWQLRFNEDIKPAVPYMNQLEIQLEFEQWDDQLQNWWEAERERFWDRPELGQAYIESLEVPMVLEDYKVGNSRISIIGKVDRIDSVNSEKVLYDYKTGRARLSMPEIEAGVKLQLPLYSYMAGKQAPIAGASYISFKDPNKRGSNGLWTERHVGKGSIFGVSGQCRNKDASIGDEAFMKKWGLHSRIEQLWKGMNSHVSVAPLGCPTSCPHKAICRVTDAMKKEAQDAIQQ